MNRWIAYVLLAGTLLSARPLAAFRDFQPRRTQPTRTAAKRLVLDSQAKPASIQIAPIAFRKTGFASWYAGQFHGRRTASGEIFNQTHLTAAHRTLPLGTTAKVTNLKNHRSVIVRINDRGPFKKGRIIDLSHAAARRLGMIASGLAPVQIEVLPVGGRKSKS